MNKSPNNYAFIDSQNLNLGIRELGWKLEYVPKKKSPRKDKNLKGTSSTGDAQIIAKKTPKVNRRPKSQAYDSDVYTTPLITYQITTRGDRPRLVNS